MNKRAVRMVERLRLCTQIRGFLSFKRCDVCHYRHIAITRFFPAAAVFLSRLLHACMYAWHIFREAFSDFPTRRNELSDYRKKDEKLVQ